MKKILILLAALLSVGYIYISTQKQSQIIPNEAIRFRVIANSNTIYDQNIKLQLKNVVQNKILEIIGNSSTIDETRKNLKSNVSEIDNLVKETLNNLNYDKKYKIKYGYNYFPEKEFKGIKYKDGNYESLVITLGEGNGDNWWCVLFPPYCLLETEDTGKKDVEYTFFLKDFIDKIKW